MGSAVHGNRGSSKKTTVAVDTVVIVRRDGKQKQKQINAEASYSFAAV